MRLKEYLHKEKEKNQLNLSNENDEPKIINLYSKQITK